MPILISAMICTKIVWEGIGKTYLKPKIFFIKRIPNEITPKIINIAIKKFNPPDVYKNPVTLSHV